MSQPTTKKKRYSYKDDFEGVYLRCDYLRRCGELKGEYAVEYAPVIHNVSRAIYNKLYPNFYKMGFDVEDLVSVANIYTLSYMELYSLRLNQQAKDKYVSQYYKKHGKAPTERHIYSKDRNNMANFLRQKLCHLATLCYRKSKNVIVGANKRGIFAETEHSVPAQGEVLLEKYEQLGYRPITVKEYKEAKAAAKKRMDKNITDKDGFAIHYVEILSTHIGAHDYSVLFHNDNSNYTSDPESLCVASENDMQIRQFEEKFKSMGRNRKIGILKNFISKNKDNKSFKEELAAARKMLKEQKSCGINDYELHSNN